MTEPVRAADGPFAIEVKAGEIYRWCACGRSDNQPFCDGSHAGTGIRPLTYVAEQDGIVKFCGCKQTRHPPLCDGSHKR